MFRLVLKFLSRLYFFNKAFSLIGNTINKGVLRFGTLVEMRGMQSL